ncbi:hypothetical protein HKX48_008197 [Thoreauomyces humboldtii]|nr:hypothetical protein HKX48_008197 [Thoreauomyces humboldtii]
MAPPDNDMMDLCLPFNSSPGTNTYKLDDTRKEQARSLATRLGISYADHSQTLVLPTAETHPVLYDHAQAIIAAHGPDEVDPDELTARKMAVDQGSDESIFLNILGGLAGFLVFDLPDGKGGFVIIDPTRDRCTAWHPRKATREAACVCGSLVLREAKGRGLAEVDDLAEALNSMAIDPETGLIRDLEQAFGGIDLEKKNEEVDEESQLQDAFEQIDIGAGESKEEVINLTAVSLPSARSIPSWLTYGHMAAPAAEVPRARRSSRRF